MTEEAPSRYLAFRSALQTDRIKDARHLNDNLQPKTVFNKIEEDPFLSTQ